MLSLSSLERYNPNNLNKLEEYISDQMRENFNDLEANLVVLKLYQFDPSSFKVNVCGEILIKALSNMPHTDFVLAKCLIDTANVSNKSNPNFKIFSLILFTYYLAGTRTD